MESNISTRPRKAQQPNSEQENQHSEISCQFMSSHFVSVVDETLAGGLTHVVFAAVG